MKSVVKEVLYMSWPTLVVVLCILIILRVSYIIRSDRKSFKLYEEVFNLFFIAYLLVLFHLVTQGATDSYGGFNLMPFDEILRYDIGSNEFYRQVIGNIILFIPLGYFAASYCKVKKFGGMFIIMFLCSSVIEITQYFIGRSFDVDDIILNVIGGMLGYVLFISFNAIKSKLPEFLKKDFICNLLTIVLLIIIGFYIYKIF